MGERQRRIYSESELALRGGAGRDEPLFDLLVLYLDRALRLTAFTREHAAAALATLDDASILSLARLLFPRGAEGEGLARLVGDPEAPDPGRLAEAVSEAWELWERRLVIEPPEGSELLDPRRAEREILAAFRACHGPRELGDPCAAQRARLASVFGLSEPETEILSFLLCAATVRWFKFVVDRLSLGDFHRVIAAAAGVEPKEAKTLLSGGGRLVRMGFVLPDFFPPPHYALGDEIRHFFADPESLYAFVRPLEERLGAATRAAPLDSFPVPAASLRVLEAVLRAGGANVLVHGTPGTGKTTFVVNLLRSLGLSAFALGAAAAGEEGRPPLLRLRAAAHIAREAKALLVVDEADSLINTQGRGPEAAAEAKAWLTEFMDCHSGGVVWIANDVSEIHDAVKRRFVYSLEFTPQDRRQRAAIWRELARGYGFEGALGGETIETLSKAHEVTAGGIDIALRGLRSVLSARGPEEGGDKAAVPVLSELLRRHEALMGGRAAPRRALRGDQALYLPEAINADLRLEELVAALSGVAARIREERRLEEEGLLDDPRSAEYPPAALEAKLLFSGGPGTGKTAFARWLAKALDLPLVQKRASDLLSCLVGGTEQRIAEAFAEAEESGALLLLDEADSLFLDRRSAERSWERSQTNELLTRMEEYSGILVCCTNRREDFDPAAMRRFQWKLSFSPPSPGQRESLYRRYFTGLCGEPGTADLAALARLDGLCPGDFAAVYKRLAPLAASRPPAAGPGHPEVLEGLRAELAFRAGGRGAAIGFAR